MTDNLYILDRETITDIFSIWKDSYLLAPQDFVDAADCDPMEQAEYLINTLQQLKKED